jgi:hypothetical protein
MHQRDHSALPLALQPIEQAKSRAIDHPLTDDGLRGCDDKKSQSRDWKST